MNAREKILRFVKANESTSVPEIDPETGHFVEDVEAHVSALLDEHAHELAERLRNIHGSGEGDAWNWWDAADIPAACADLIDPKVGTS